jgi:hypothetical protein
MLLRIQARWRLWHWSGHRLWQRTRPGSGSGSGGGHGAGEGTGIGDGTGSGVEQAAAEAMLAVAQLRFHRQYHQGLYHIRNPATQVVQEVPNRRNYNCAYACCCRRRR